MSNALFLQLKTISIKKFISIHFCYIYIYCRKFNAENNKLIKQQVIVFVFFEN